MFDNGALEGRLLLTGAAGFIGNSLVKNLSNKNLDIVVVDSPRRIEKYACYSESEVTLVPYEWPNIPNLRKLGGFDYIAHLAWSTNPASSMMNIRSDAASNILGTINLLEELRNINCSKFVFLSSGGTVYGNCCSGTITEKDVTSPISAYGISKLACEKYVDLYSKLTATASIILRLGNPYGPYQLKGTPVGVISSFIKNIHDKKPIQVFGDGENVRDFIHIDDVTRAVSACWTVKDASGVLNLGSGKGYSINQILSIITDLTAVPFKVEYLPDRRSDVREIVLDVDKAKNILDFECKISLHSGISEMLDIADLGRTHRATRSAAS